MDTLGQFLGNWLSEALGLGKEKLGGDGDTAEFEGDGMKTPSGVAVGCLCWASGASRAWGGPGLPREEPPGASRCFTPDFTTCLYASSRNALIPVHREKNPILCDAGLLCFPSAAEERRIETAQGVYKQISLLVSAWLLPAGHECPISRRAVVLCSAATGLQENT